jgi:hypothetical protein
MFYNGKQPAQCDNTSITYGWVYRISKQQEVTLDETYSIDRLRTGQCVTVTNPQQPNGSVGLPVIFYWDPRHTRNGSNFERWNNSEREQLKWQNAAELLKKAGAENCFIEHVMEIAQGPEPEYDLHEIALDPAYKPLNNTLYMNPLDLHYTPLATPAKPKPDLIPGLKPAIGRAENGIARLQTPPPVALSVTQVHSTSRPQSSPQSHLPTPPQSSSKQSYAQPNNKSPSTPTPTGPGPNVKMVKKRMKNSDNDGGQPRKKSMKKLPPGPSNLRHNTPAEP